MKVLYGLEKLDPPLQQSVLTIGNFDGVHRAHQQLLAQACLFAANTGGPVVVMTLEPHPLSVVGRRQAPPRLSPLEQKLELLGAQGADLVVVAKSEPALLGLEADRFVEEVIVKRFHPTHLVEGPSFGFGRGRKGTSQLLQRLGPKHGFEVHVVDPISLQIEEGEMVMVSSSLVRRLLLEGKVRRAALCLGRPYSLFGEVVAGASRGRSLGFPTANVAVGDQLVPGNGVFAGRAMIGDATYLAAISIGHTPTFPDGQDQVEAFLLEFDGDVYGERIQIEFHHRLRDQRKFASPDALVAQLRRDVECVRHLLSPKRKSGKEKERTN
ncbi:MAG: bifunctional riboflavin kinase/FAD synthetase [Phycisphaerales bacterium]|nr:MAG: bifunctional riboflavin kinase/FAD synthetase [Phycisphaerales bacterium]